MSADRPYGHADAGRSPVMARHGMVATSQPLAAQAGLRILQDGGNAFDAAIAAAAMLAVVEPMMTGPGGDVFLLAHHAASGALVGLNGSGFSPAAATPERLAAKGLGSIPTTGPCSVSIPGAVDAWTTIHARYGKLPFAKLLEPAIAYAEEGFPVTPIIAGDWGVGGALHAAKPEFRRVFLKDSGEPYRHGEIFRNPDLARTLRQIAEGGRDAFYQGPFARAMSEEMTRLGWPVTLDDLAFQRSDWVDPVSTTYCDVELFELPPNGQGMAALEMLNILEPFDLAALGHNSAAYLHLLIEAKKLAFADLAAWNADPEQADLPVSTIVSKDYAARQRTRIDMQRASPGYASGIADGSSDTVYLTVVDQERNAVSFINSIFHNFGSGVVVPGTGVVLQNRGALFTLQANHPNRLARRKRPYHTIIPAMAFRNGKPWLSFGVMGGDMQPQGHVQVLLNMLLFGMDVQQAGEAARFRHHPDEGLALESAIGPTVTQQLARMGHDIRTRPGTLGGYQAIEIDSKRYRL
ncbi:MAG: gamma-glutamyltransferase, partial [Acidobacteria bacterium]|nr:gamma-glutamyltransferase [Acidobacteriota bacterium]